MMKIFLRILIIANMAYAACMAFVGEYPAACYSLLLALLLAEIGYREGAL